MWQVTEDNVESIAIGAGILGAGGGNPYIGQLRARQALREWGPVAVLQPDELPEDSRVVCVGAPTVGIEKVRDFQSYYALRAIEKYGGVPATALISNEIGGSSSVEPLIPAARAGLPVVLVGGGNVLVGNSLEGASQVIRPEHADVANAIGAAIAQVGGQVERV